MERIVMTEEALNYPNQWVAFSGDFKRVVGYGDSPKDAHDMANEAGEEHAILLFIPEQWPDALIL